MREVADREAVKEFSLLLADAERGEIIAIMRDGKKVAELKAVSADQNAQEPKRMASRDEVKIAMRRIRENARQAGMTFNLEEIKRWRDEGRA